MYDVSVTFGSHQIISLDGRITRGTSPNTWRIRIPHESAITADAGILRFVSDSGAVTLRSCIPDLSTLRTEHHDGKREWVLLLRDRRATWQGKTISGRYNRRGRDNTIDGPQLNAQYLANLIMTAAGERGIASSLPATYPDIDWDRTPIDKAIDELLAPLPGHVCRDNDDQYGILTTGDGDGIDSSWPAIIPDYLAQIESGPRTVRIKCRRTIFGAALELEAVGLDLNGEYKLLNNLTYTPATGWDQEWPSLFSGVDVGKRQIAFDTVFRCYRIKVPQTLTFGGDTFYLTDLEDIEIDDRRLLMDLPKGPPPLVTGTYWPMGDHPYNTANCPAVSCGFTVDKSQKLITFEYPIFKLQSCVAPADLKLGIAFHLRDSSGEWERETVEVQRNYGEGEWQLQVDHLWRARAKYYVDCGVTGQGDNRNNVRAEALVYAQAWADHFDEIRDKRHVSVAGVRPVATTGKIACVKFRVGRGLVPQTTASVNFVPAT